jgi:heat shock protein HslJ
MTPEGAMDQEQEFLAFLGASESYQTAGGKLQLMHAGRVVLEFISQD